MKVICFGGGNALPKVVLEELKKIENIDITTVTSMTDSGGSTGALRKEFDVLPPGDIRRHILALSEAEEWKKELWKFRFANDLVFEDGHRGHNFGNVFLAGLEKIFGDYEKVLETVWDFMRVKGKTLPATLQKVNLYAETEKGLILKGEGEIDIGKNKENEDKIKKIWLEPEAEAYPVVLEEIKNSDFIIIGPGDLFSSILPAFLPKGIEDEMKKSKAVKIFIAPAMTKFSETYKFTLEDYVDWIERYIGKLDYVIYNTQMPEENVLKNYKKKHPEYDEVLTTTSPKENYLGVELLEADKVEYDRKKVINVLLDIFQRKSQSF